MEYYPGEQVDEADVGCEERHDLRAAQDAQGVDIQVIGDDPEEAEEAATTQELA